MCLLSHAALKAHISKCCSSDLFHNSRMLLNAIQPRPTHLCSSVYNGDLNTSKTNPRCFRKWKQRRIKYKKYSCDCGGATRQVIKKLQLIKEDIQPPFLWEIRSIKRALQRPQQTVSPVKKGLALYEWWFPVGLRLSGEEMPTAATLKWGPPCERCTGKHSQMHAQMLLHTSSVHPAPVMHTRKDRREIQWKYQWYSELDKQSSGVICWINEDFFKLNNMQNDLCHTNNNINSYKS